MRKEASDKEGHLGSSRHMIESSKRIIDSSMVCIRDSDQDIGRIMETIRRQKDGLLTIEARFLVGEK